jgi:pyridinium-3,5-biscarboxylic acid mononucleotide sulfurtransferase
VNTEEKIKRLNEILAALHSAAVAFSGGVDSTFLAEAARRVLGDKLVLVTARSETLAQSEQKDVQLLAEKLGVRHVWLDASELDDAAFTANTADRCFFCKKGRFTELCRWARAEGVGWVLEGSNVDDLSDYRPGMRAIAGMDMVRSPLLEAGFTKEDIRVVSCEWDLPTWNKLSAACLASRMAYGLAITPERLAQVDAAEELVKRYVRGQVRVRHHGDLARVEVEPSQTAIIVRPETASAVASGLKKLGFTFVALDLAGYRTGSMNEVLDEVE